MPVNGVFSVWLDEILFSLYSSKVWWYRRTSYTFTRLFVSYDWNTRKSWQEVYNNCLFLYTLKGIVKFDDIEGNLKSSIEEGHTIQWPK
jgi:hypothetical protein